MKYAILALAALASLALTSAKESFYDQEGYKFQMDERLGHFAKEPFTDLYKQYAVAFIAPSYPDRPADDYRNYRPSADVCRNFFAGFQGQDYNIHDLDQLIVLDACLGYVVDKVYENDEDASEAYKDYFRKLDPRVPALYETGIDSFGAAERSCIADLMINVVLAKKDYPDQECNNHMLQMYIQFAECQSETSLSEKKNSDNYVSIIYRIVKERVQRCMDVEVEHINRAVRNRFGSEWFKRASLSVARGTQKKQQKSRKWPTPMVTLLSAIQNTTEEVNLRQVHQILAHVQHDDEIMRKIFFNNVASFADRVIKPTKSQAKPKSKAFDDPNGANRYKRLIDSVCNVFRSSDSEKDYDFATPLIRMVELLNHVEIFDVTRDVFVRKLVTHTHESVPLYLCVSACNMLTYTEGTYNTAKSGKPHYEVHFVPNNEKMVSWPKAPYV